MRLKMIDGVIHPAAAHPSAAKGAAEHSRDVLVPVIGGAFIGNMLAPGVGGAIVGGLVAGLVSSQLSRVREDKENDRHTRCH